MLAKAYGMKVLASRRNPGLSEQDPHLDKIYPTSDLEEMVRESDYGTFQLVGLYEKSLSKPLSPSLSLSLIFFDLLIF